MSTLRSAAALAAAAVLGLSGCSTDNDGAVIGAPDTSPIVTTTTTTTPAAPVVADDQPETDRRITVTGTGEASGVPDRASLSLGIEVRAATTTETLASARAASDVLHETLLASGVDPKDLQTTTMSVYPDYMYPPAGVPTPSGYMASVMLTVNTPFDDASRIVDDAAVAVGDAFRVNSLVWSVSDSEPLRVQARQAALADARATATQLAEEANLALGEIVSITEGSSAGMWGPYGGEGEGGNYDIPFAPGQATITATVTVTYELTETNG